MIRFPHPNSLRPPVDAETHPARRALGVLVVALMLFALAAPAATARAQTSSFTLSGLGGRVGLVSPEDLDSVLGVGFHLEFMRPGTHWHFSPEVRYWKDDPLSDTNLNLNAFYHFAESGRISPYLGVGAGVHIYSFDVDDVDGETEFGANLLGGVLLPVHEDAHVFLEGRYVITDLSQFDLLIGLTVPLAE